MTERSPLDVKLDIFEGPLDLLLHLIRKNKVDIYDIPIYFITEKYLEYIDMMKTMNLDLAGEFILMAATLIHIKSRMLLPIPEEGVLEEEEGVDPRSELVRKLLEYERYRLAAEELNGRILLGRDVFTRGMTLPLDGISEDSEIALTDLSIFDLIAAFGEIIKKLPKPYQIDLTVDRFRVTDKMNHLLEALSMERSITFSDLFPETCTRGEVIVTFLAVLELCKLFMIKVNQTEDGVIRIYRPQEVH